MATNSENLPSMEMLISGFIPNRRGRRPTDLPTVRTSDGTLVPRYLVEKRVGLRRENGALKLRRLTHRHLAIIALHLQSHSIEQIAMERRCTIGTVSRILNDPLAQHILKRVYEDRQGEIQALGGQAIEAVRQGLASDSIGTKLRAVDKYAKIRETMLPAEKSDESAEDVIARMFARMNIVADNVQINVNASTDSTEG